MIKKILYLVFLLTILVFYSPLYSFASSPWSFNFDLKYENNKKTKAIQGDEENNEEQQEEKTKELQHEYQIRYNNPISMDTKLNADLRAKFEKEVRDYSSSEGNSETTKIYEPQGTFRLKSRLYELKSGYKELDNSTSANTNQGYIDFKLQPEYLPEFSAKYDLKKEIDPNSPLEYIHKFTLNSSYNIKNAFKIRLNYRGKITDYRKIKSTDQADADTKEGNFLGQMTFKHYMFQKKIRFDLDYKLETEKEKEEDPNNGVYWIWTQDRLIQTTSSKVTYKMSSLTTFTTHYENKNIKNEVTDEDTGDEKKDTFWIHLNQKIASNLKLLIKYKYENNDKEIEKSNRDTYETEITANLRKWLVLQGKVKYESEDSYNPDESDSDKKSDNQSVEGIWKAHFDELFDARNMFNLKFTKDKDESDDDPSKETHFKWRLQLTPIPNLTLKPEYNVTTIKDNPHSKETRYEFKNVTSYKLSLADQLVINLSYTLNREREKREEGNNTTENRKESNDDVNLDIKFTPVKNLIFTTQIIWEKEKTEDIENTDRSYAFNSDWRFEPFIWSNSFKYNDKGDDDDTGGDTETIETKLTYRIKKFHSTSYTVTANYKYEKTYFEPGEKEQTIGLQLRANF